MGDDTIVVEELMAARLQWFARPYPYGKDNNDGQVYAMGNPVQNRKFSPSPNNRVFRALVIARSFFIVKKRWRSIFSEDRSVENRSSHAAETLSGQGDRSSIQYNGQSK
jgi:hypothetical protein